MFVKRVSRIIGLILIFSITLLYYQVPGLFKARDKQSFQNAAENVDFTESLLEENTCMVPIIVPYEDNLMNFVTLFGPTHCNSQMPNLAYVTIENKLIITTEIEKSKVRKLPPFRCYYRGISGGLFDNKTSYTFESESIEVMQNVATDIKFTNFVVQCKNNTEVGRLNGVSKNNGSVIYQKAFTSFPGFKEKEKKAPKASADSPSLAILVLDSVARNQFLRHMPETTKLMKKLGFTFLEGYTKVGDNSAVNLMPVLAGKSILPQVGGIGKELLDSNSTIDLESTEFLWNLMQERGCVTMFNDDILNVGRGLFHYPDPPFVGFKKPPTDYYFRPYHLFNTINMVKKDEQCMKSGQVNAVEYLKIYERFSLRFKDACHFSFNFLTGLTHDDSSYLNALDEPLRITLERFIANEVTKNTVLVIMGDHGNRIGQIQTSYAGRIEERMPLFSIYLPPKIVDKCPHLLNNLKYNAKRLVSNYDVHQTLRDIANGNLVQSSQKTSKSYTRGISLFSEKVSPQRDCEDAGIPPNFCVCMEVQKVHRLNSTSMEYMKVHELIREKFANNYSHCVYPQSIKINGEHLNVYGINQMVRHGLRNQDMYPKVAAIHAALEILFFKVQVSANLRHVNHAVEPHSSIILTIIIKHYVKQFSFEIINEPIVQLNSSMTRISQFCVS